MATLYRLFGGLDRLVDPLSPPSGAALPPHRARLLLGVLLLTPGRRWQRTALVRLLFRNEDGPTQRARLSDQLYLLRQGCPELELSLSHDTVGWSGRGASTDYSVFLKDTEEKGPTAAPARLETLVSALELYHGDLLPEYDLDLVNEAREHARVRFAAALRKVAARLEQEGRLTEAQRWYERRLSTHPHDEDVLLRYLRTCRELGQRGRGLEAYRVGVRSLEELSLTPTKELRNLALELKGTAGAARPRTVEATDAASAVDRAWWLLSESGAKAGLERHQGAAEPGWNLRRLMLFEIRGQWRELGEQIRRFLGERVLAAQGLEPAVQALALILLGRAQAEVDSVAEALRSLDKAVLLLRQTRDGGAVTSVFSPFAPAEAHLAWVELLQANLHLRAGNPGTATEALRRLGGRLDDLGNREGEWVEVLKLRCAAALGSLLLQIGKATWASSELDRAQTLCRTLKATELQEQLDTTRASALDVLGRWDLSGPLLEAAAERLGRTQDRFEEGKVLYNWAAHLGNRPDGDREKACRIARRAIDAFASVGAAGWEASTNTTLGFLLWQQGRPRQALEAYSRAKSLHLKLEEPMYVTEIYGYEALCRLDLGELESALALSREGVEASLSGSDTTVTPDLWLIRAECLRSAGQGSQVPALLTQAADLVFAEARELPDAEACAALLRRDPLARLLISRLEEHGLLARYLERLPPSAFVSPASARGGRSIALRRHRLLEAQEKLTRQGELASAARLARIVGAGVRTVERDLAHLRKAGTGGTFPR